MSDVYQFAGFVLDPKTRTLRRGGTPLRLTPKAFDILLFLVRNPNRVVSKHELMKAVWPDTFVEEGNLTVTVSVLRKTLAEYSRDDRLIVTLARQGYQFTADVTVVNGSETAAGPSPNTPEPAGNPTEQVSVNGVERDIQVESTAAGGLPSAHQTQWPRWAIVGALSTIVLAASYLAWQRPRPAVATRSSSRLAVLPCLNLTGDPKKEYLADGITEELISRLAQLDPQTLSVIARTSVMGYKQPGTPLDAIGRDLGVQHVLESSVRSSAGGRLRVTVQMIDVKSQSHLWSRDYDYQTREILGLEEDVADAVARQIQPRLTARPLADSARSHIIPPAAIDALFRGYYLHNNPPTDSLVNQELGYYEQAIKLDSTYALAWVALSRLRRRQAEFGFAPHEEAYRQARVAADRAIALDSGLGAAYDNLAWIQMNHDREWVGANASVQRALRLDPGNAVINSDASRVSSTLGRYDEALSEAQRAVELDPLNYGVQNWLGILLVWLNRPQEATASFRRSLELRNDALGTHAALALAYLAEGRAQDALLEVDKEQTPYWRLQIAALADYHLGRLRQSDSALAELIAQNHGEAAFQIAEIYAYRGETEQAFRWLERAAAQRDAGIATTKADNLLSNLRSDPRYSAFLAKVHLPQ